MRISDNTVRPQTDFVGIPTLTARIADKTLEQLEREGVFIFPELISSAEDVTGDEMILQSVNDRYRSGNVMGFLGIGSERLTIASRFSTDRHDYFFQYLLERVLDVPNILSLETDANQNDRLFNLLLFLFPYCLRQAARKGVFKTYMSRQYNDGNIRGSIDLSRHIRINTPFIGNVAYRQREFSHDNYVMEIIRHTIEFIKRQSYGNVILRRTKDEVSAVIASTGRYQYFDRNRLIAENNENPIRHAYFREYRALQRLCVMILQHRRHQIGAGTHQIRGILFDGAWLWEEYVASLITEAFHHPKNKARTGAQQLFSTAAGKAGRIYPDFIGKDVHHSVIADAKYKPIGNIGNKDYLQLLAYMFRFEARQGIYLYPEQADAEPVTLMMNRGSSYEDNVAPRGDVSVTKCGLCIPQNADSYHGFAATMRVSEHRFASRIMDAMGRSGMNAV